MKTSQVVRLGDVCGISSYLVDPRLPEYRQLPHIGGANIESITGGLVDLKTAQEEGLKSGKFLFDEQAVLYSKIRPYLMKVARPTFSGLCSADIYPLSPNKARLDRNFLFHLLLTPAFTEFAIAGSARAGMPKVNRDHLFEFEFPLPPLADQRRIVRILDEAFAAIATAKANAQKNLQNARALFDSHLQAVFTQRGEGWGEKTLSEVCEISSFLVDPRMKEYLDLPHVGGANIESKTGNLVDLKTAREEGLISGKFVFAPAVVLYSKIRPYLMKVARPDFRGLCSADIYPLSAKSDQLDRDYLFHLLLSPEFTEYASAGSARAGMPKVNRDHLFAFRFYLPSVKKQKEISTKLDALLAETQRLAAIYEKKLAALEALKKSLLHQAFTGQL